MTSIVRRWGMSAWMAGLLTVATLLLLVVAGLSSVFLEGAGTAIRPASASELAGRFADAQARFTLHYPANWGTQRLPSGVLIWPNSRGATFAERGAALYILVQPTGSALPGDLPPILQTAMQPTEQWREAEHVAVGGLAGVEQVFQVPSTSAGLSQLSVEAQGALDATTTQAITAALWESDDGEQHYWVVMVDARDGAYLPRLEQIRDTIQWTGK